MRKIVGDNNDKKTKGILKEVLWTNMVGKMRDKLYNANKIDKRDTRKKWYFKP